MNELGRFFVVVPPGFETETRREIEEVWPFLLDPAGRPQAAALPEMMLKDGGLEFSAELGVGLQMNLFLKTASRILLRLDEFRARDFPKLHARLRKSPLSEWIPSGAIHPQVAAASSRLGHEGRLREVALDAWKEFFREDESGPRVYLRMQDDVCTLSLDTSGEHLHRRGLMKEVGRAPVRETLAAFLIRRLINEAPPGHLRNIELVDPMAGSGHLLTEAESLWRPNLGREFAFQNWKRGPKVLRRHPLVLSYPPSSSPFAVYTAFDNDASMAGLLQKSPVLNSRREDLFVGELEPSAAEERWLISNPPYGLRMKAPPPGRTLDRMIEKFRPTRLGILLPDDQARGLRWPEGWVRVSETPVKNGGLPCRFVVREKPRGE